MALAARLSRTWGVGLVVIVWGSGGGWGRRVCRVAEGGGRALRGSLAVIGVRWRVRRGRGLLGGAKLEPVFSGFAADVFQALGRGSGRGLLGLGGLQGGCGLYGARRLRR